MEFVQDYSVLIPQLILHGKVVTNLYILYFTQLHNNTIMD